MLYRKHIFLCTNQKTADKPCCANHQADNAVAYLKERLKELGLHGPGKIRVSASGCLGRCKLGPSVVVYPEGVWYRYHNTDDLEHILQEHLMKDNVVEDLLMDKTELL